MSQNYFSYIPDFNYISRTPGARIIDQYTKVKNLFKRGIINPDLLGDIANFVQYKIVGDERPDNVAEKYYGDSNLDWCILLTNNILNIETEWPLAQESFYNYMIDKYGTESEFEQVHHYETVRILDSQGDLITPGGLEVSSDFSVTFFDDGIQQQQTIKRLNTITNLQYETQKEERKRNIFLLKDYYVGIIIDEMETSMPYRKGSSQYVSPDLVEGENIRLYP